MKKLLALALASLLTASVALAQTTLTVGLFEPLNEHLDRVMDLFIAEHPGVTLDVRTLGYADHHDALVTYLATGSGAPDVVAIEIGYIARFVAEGGLRDLSSEPFSADQYEDLFVQYAWAQGRTADGRQIALPTDIGPGVMYYRRDHLETTGWTIEDVVSSIDNYIQYGRDLKAIDVYLVASAASVADALIRSDVPAGSGIYFDADGRPLLNSERFLDAARVAKTIRDEGLDAEIGSWSNEWYEAFRTGTTATELSGAWLGGHLQTWMAPETAGLWGASVIPDERLLSWGGSFYGIPNQTPAEKLDLAWELVKFLTIRPDIQLQAFKSINAFPALPSTYDDPMFDEPLEFLANQPARQLFANVAENIPGVLTFPGDMVAQEIWNSALTEVLNEGRDIQEALDEAQSLVERRVRR